MTGKLVKSFHKTLEQLKLLQVILNEKFNLERKLQELPREISLQEQMVFRMKENFLAADIQYRELKKNVDLKHDELTRLQEHREKYEKEIIKVSSQRDYEQIDKAIKDNIEQEQLIRAEINALDLKFKTFAEEYSNTEQLLKNQEQVLQEKRGHIDNQLMDCNTALQGIKNKEANITTFLDDKLVFKFERIIRSKGGEGIVPIRKNICNGCHMVLPMQFVNEVRKENHVLNCPYCSKILYFSEDAEEETLDTEEISGLQDLFEDEDIVLDDFDEEDYELFIEGDNIGSDSYSVPIEEEGDEEEEEDDDTETFEEEEEESLEEVTEEYTDDEE